jgi:hypothetical protein
MNPGRFKSFIIQSKILLQFVVVFWIGNNMVVKITRSSSEMVLQTTNHTMIYPGLDSSSKVIALRPAV